MKKLILVVIAAACFNTSAYAVDGHNGIRFDMTQKDLEAKGFVCRAPKAKQTNDLAECQHMDFTGVAFGFPTNDYRIFIGSNGKVDRIIASFSGNFSYTDSLSLGHKIEHFFPNKKRSATVVSEIFQSETWVAENNAVAVTRFIRGTPPFLKNSFTIIFGSPESMK